MSDPESRYRKSWLRSLGFQLFGVPWGVALGLFIYFHEHSDFGILIAALTPTFVAINVGTIHRSRRRLAEPGKRADTPTGEVLIPVIAPPISGLMPARWVGAADMVGGLGRMNASTPLGVLELSGQSLTLRVRPRFLARIFGVQPLVVEPNEVEAVFPSRGRLRTRAICIRPLQQPPSYFLTVGGDRSAILSAIASGGFPVDWNERAFSFS
jgi:hypothetical protein